MSKEITQTLLRAYHLAYPGSTIYAAPAAWAEMLNQSCFVLDLQIALEKAGWTFWFDGENFVSIKIDKFEAPTKPELLLKIVEGMP